MDGRTAPLPAILVQHVNWDAVQAYKDYSTYDWQEKNDGLKMLYKVLTM